jgi:hypothetical protein
MYYNLVLTKLQYIIQTEENWGRFYFFQIRPILTGNAGDYTAHSP